MRELPETLIIFGREFTVSVEEIEGGDLGACNPNTEEIKISPDQRQKDRLHSLIHEMGHAVIYRTGIFQGLDEKVIEVIVENMATAILENFTLIKKKK